MKFEKLFYRNAFYQSITESGLSTSEVFHTPEYDSDPNLKVCFFLNEFAFILLVMKTISSIIYSISSFPDSQEELHF